MAKTEEAPQPDEVEVKGGKKKLLVIALVGLLVAGAAAWFLVLAPSGEAEAEVAPEPGAVLALEPVAVNLAGGSYLKISIALQFTYEAGLSEEAEPDGSKAQALIISSYSGATVGDVMANREAMKEALKAHVIEAYEGEVMDIYLTEYVTQ